MQGKFNAGRMVPGQNNIPGVNLSKSFTPEAPDIPVRKSCPWGIDCRRCHISVHKDGKLMCSIKVLAVEAMKEGVKIAGKS